MNSAPTTWEDAGFDPALLEQNLTALAQQQPVQAAYLREAGIHEQLRLVSHEGKWLVHRIFRRRLYEIEEDETSLAGPLESKPGRADARFDLLCGLGLGERAKCWAQALEKNRGLIVHEPDPSLILLSLSRHDYRKHFLGGELQLLCGADIRAQSLPPIRQVFLHPKTAFLVHWDWQHIQNRTAGQTEKGSPTPLRATAVSVLLGELLQEECALSFQAQGYDIHRLDATILSAEQIERELALVEPKASFAINFVPELAELSGRLGFPFLCWEIDPTASTLQQLKTMNFAGQTAQIHTWRRSRVDLFKAAGYQHVDFLPLAADETFRRPPKKSDIENHELVFVGSCMAKQAAKHRQMLDTFITTDKARLTAWQSFLKRVGELADEIDVQPCRLDIEQLLQDALLEQELPLIIQTPEGPADVIILAGETIAARKRIAVVRSLLDHKIVVYGEEDWQEVLPSLDWCGPLGHGEALNKIYGNASINIDINRIYQADIVTLRHFEIAACGGFLLTEDTPQLRELFEVGREVAVYSDLADLKDKVAYYLEQPDERQHMAKNLRRRFLDDHRVQQRIEKMLRMMKTGKR